MYRYDIGIFYDDLDPYGSWLELEPYGYVWIPRGVARDWRPYTVGHWAYTDYGWTWVSYEDWGWAVFHYGRWFRHRRHGWVWIPGTQWAPAWVAWRYGGGYSGWAPLPPEVRWRAGVGLDLGGLDIDVVIDSGAWCFVEDHYILEPRVVTRVVPVTRNVTVVRVTKNVTRYTVVEKRVVNHGIEVDRVERAVRKPVPRARVVAMDSPDKPGARTGTVTKNEVRIFKPTVEDRAPSRKPRVSTPPAEPSAPGSPRPTGPRPTVPAPPPHSSPPAGDLPPATGDSPRKSAPPSMERRQALERQRLEQRQAAERKTLEERQEAERKSPPKGVTKEELTRRQTQERRKLELRQQQERRDAEARRAKQRENPQQSEDLAEEDDTART
jgi:hypothetical protein